MKLLPASCGLVLGLGLVSSLFAQSDVTIQNTTYGSGSAPTVQATNTITASTNVTVQPGANVTYVAGSRITLGPGFSVQAGGVFQAIPNVDSDSDGMPDWWERQNSFDYNNAADALGDADGDGLSNVAEFNLGNGPRSYNQGTSSLGNTLPAGWSPLVAAHASKTDAVGTTAGQLTVDKSGAATYSVPIWTTPGTAGMEPKVALNYSSQAGAGIAGFGWSLGGVSAISRGPKTLAVDGVIHGVDFSRDDQYYLDGQRLILVSGTHGYAGADYRTELESFSRIVAQGSAGNGPESFKVWTKAGLIIEFGGAAGSRLMRNDKGAAITSPTEVYTWAVSKISDTAGNYMEFIYDSSAGVGEQRLSRINYTGHDGAPVQIAYASLRFEYDTGTRPDPTLGYVAGSKFATSKRLKYVRSYYGETLARTYTLNYTTRPLTNRSLLTSVVETGTDGKSYPALTFDYSNPSAGWDYLDQATWAPPAPIAVYNAQPRGTGFVDLNGDGRPDFVRYRSWNNGANIERDAWLNDAVQGWVPTAAYTIPQGWPLAIDNLPDTGTRFVDFNGDGLLDVAGLNGDEGGFGSTETQSFLNTGSGFAATGRWSLPVVPPGVTGGSFRTYQRVQGTFVDLNGDGRPDYVCVGQFRTYNFSGNVIMTRYREAWLNRGVGADETSGAGWEYAAQYSAPLDPEKGARYLDVNGDGLPDQVQHWYGDNTAVKGVALNTGSGWNILAQGSADFNRYLPPELFNTGAPGAENAPVGTEIVDFNGDGLADLLRRNDAAGEGYPNAAYLNTGYGWVSAPEFLAPFTLAIDHSPRGVAFIDVNSDGIVDCVMGLDSQREVRLGTGTGWSASASDHDLIRQLANADRPTVGTDFVDLNADGAPDEAWHWVEGGTVKNSVVNRRANPDRLNSVTNGFGVKAQLSYKPLTDPTVYTKGQSSGDADSVNVIGPMYVVSQVRHDDGAGGTYDLNYAYGELRTHRLRGSQGFGWMNVLDTRTQLASTTIFEQRFPYTGMVKQSYTKRDGGTGATLSETEVWYREKLLNNNLTHFVFAQRTLELGRDLDNSSVVVKSVETITQRGNAETDTYDYDDYGNSKYIWVNSGDGFAKTTTSEFTNTVTSGKWHLGRLTSSTVVAEAPGVPSITRKSSFVYDPNTGLLTSETVEPDRASEIDANGNAANLTLTTTYGYDEFGNKISVTVSGGGLSANRVTTTTYNPADVGVTGVNGRLPMRTTNALTHAETYAYENGTDKSGQYFGAAMKLTGPNDLPTSWVYDGFGRKIKETRADNTVTETRYKWAGSGAPAGSLYLIETEATGASPSVTFHDALGRAFYSYGLNGGLLDGNARIVGTRTEYDSKGRAFRTSLPFYFGDTPQSAVETTLFDILDRPKTVLTRHETGFVTMTYSYDGLTTRASVATGPNTTQRTDSTRNLAGMTVSTVNNATAAANSVDRGEVSYGYDAMGNLTTTSVRKQDGSWVTTTLTYDVRGRKVRMQDPDMGTWRYSYNAVGELVWQKDAKNQVTTMVYDQLGRLTNRGETEGATTWTYDTAPRGSAAWYGKLAAVTGPADRGRTYSESYAYDGLGRPSTLLRTIDGVGYSTMQEYDNVGRPSVTTYPTGFRVRNVYNAFGFLKEVRADGGVTGTFANEISANHLFWQADSYSIWGQVDGSVLGNGLSYDKLVSATTGRVLSLTAGVGAGTAVQFHQYTYDVLGNVMSRVDAAVNRSESFGYDGLNRLKSHAVVGGSTVTVNYDSLGNITYKSDVGNYAYDSSLPHAVTTAGGNSYSYDANGNMFSGGGRSLQWTSFNQFRKVTQNGQSSEFWFGAGRERVVQQHSNGTKTIYAGALFEKVEHGSGLIEEKHYIMTPLGRTAVRTVRNDAKVETRYFHQDALGSIAAVTTETGKVEQRYTFDAWGKRVKTADAHTWSGGDQTRGYTDHEHLDDFGLIHMNGRVYDPVLGRFLSADPYVDDVTDSQAFNRYSYVTNNPLLYTDPSGFFKLKDALKIVAIVVIAVVAAVYLGPLVGGFLNSAFGVAAGSAAAGYTAAIGAGIAGGFASGFAASLLNGGSIGDAFKAGVIGGAIGGATAGLLHWAGGASGAGEVDEWWAPTSEDIQNAVSAGPRYAATDGALYATQPAFEPVRSGGFWNVEGGKAFLRGFASSISGVASAIAHPVDTYRSWNTVGEPLTPYGSKLDHFLLNTRTRLRSPYGRGSLMGDVAVMRGASVAGSSVSAFRGGLTGGPLTVSAAENVGANSAINAARLRTQLAAEEIAGGHAYGKHVVKQGEFPGITSPKQFAGEIDRIMTSPSEVRHLSNGRTAYWDNATNTVVIRNPAAADGGTAFRPTAGKSYFDNLK